MTNDFVCSFWSKEKKQYAASRGVLCLVCLKQTWSTGVCVCVLSCLVSMQHVVEISETYQEALPVVWRNEEREASGTPCGCVGPIDGG